MRVSEWMLADPPTIRAEAPVEEAGKLAEELGLAIVYVVDGEGRLVGFLTRKAIAAAPDPALPTGKLAAAPTVTLSPDDPMERAVVLLGERHLLLPVVEEGRLVGVVTRGGVLRALAEMAGFGEEGIRIRVKLAQPGEVYRALEVLERNDLTLVAVIRGEEGEVIIHVQGLQDKEKLMRELEEALG
ncbi:CBS domain-containing protein [Candidatus Bipolaricaulota bacterium]|nr:CBS domain-containing protein [Candidatus Bipolaricaulota bacterium]